MKRNVSLGIIFGIVIIASLIIMGVAPISDNTNAKATPTKTGPLMIPTEKPLRDSSEKEVGIPGFGGVRVIQKLLDSGVEVRIEKISVVSLPHREQIFFQREALEVQQYRDGKSSGEFKKGSLMIFMELGEADFSLYEKTPERFVLHRYDDENKKWERCDTSLETNGEKHRLTCPGSGLGYYALGYLSE